MNLITKRQQEILDFIKLSIHSKGYPPTISEISKHFDFGITAAVGHLKSLEKKEYIKREKYRSRALIVLTKKDLS